VSGESVSFSLHGTSVGSATTNSSGVATVSNVSIAGIAASSTAYTGYITAAFGGDATIGYTTSSGSNNLTVNKAALTVTANNASKTYGAANPAFSVSYSGFVNGDHHGRG
jgi:MBG domain (YGX type)